MAILVTRPLAQGQELCRLLTNHQIPAVCHPIMEIIPGRDLPQLGAQIQHADILIAVSQHAATHAHHQLQAINLSWPQAKYFAIGKKTAQALENSIQQAVLHPLISDSEHLLAMSELQQLSNQHILILRGNGGRETLYQGLKARGANVSYSEVYQRKMLPFNSAKLVPLWQSQHIDSLIMTSGNQLEYFLSQLSSSHLNWALGLNLLLPSPRLVEKATQIGFRQITCTQGASNQDILRAISKMKQDL
ncbi:uroporphyrinogen-III synthase [Vibrio sp. S4M6]|uniref:uroporphyrinogen-III synthase n=1 Tax=Vibrio sinus TaxID=2946865 RepID=UPI00202AC112|nr:uroporphyrinogen-III synthase [Vibrio sinus]MCL9783544.1 uroporphyrinogen-III synthase [Vibrio sinus]